MPRLCTGFQKARSASVRRRFSLIAADGKPDQAIPAASALQLSVALGQKALVVDDGAGVGSLADGAFLIPGPDGKVHQLAVFRHGGNLIPTGVGASWVMFREIPTLPCVSSRKV